MEEKKTALKKEQKAVAVKPKPSTKAAEKKDGPTFKVQFTSKELTLIKETKCMNATDAQFGLFIYDCQMRGLNPLKGEIHFVLRNSYNSKTKSYEQIATHQTGIDGFRIIADRSGKYRGQTKVEYGDDIDFHGTTAPEYAEIGVYRDKFTEPVFGRAYFSEYAAVFNKDGKSYLGSMWAQMPKHMIAKCAEALALRKAFPDSLAGLYADAEMQQSENPPVVRVVEVDNGPVKKKKFEEIATTPDF